jgi:hypothetical protein
VHPHAFHQGILETLARSPAHRVHGLRALALAVAGQQPSPNAEIDIAREIAIAAELLALRGLISIDRARGQAAFSLTQLGQAFMRPPRAKAAAPALAGAVALTTALTGCASIIAPAAPPSAAAPSLHDLRQLAPARIEQVVDPYSGLAYFARCSDCATPTRKTLASESGPPVLISPGSFHRTSWGALEGRKAERFRCNASRCHSRPSRHPPRLSSGGTLCISGLQRPE